MITRASVACLCAILAAPVAGNDSLGSELSHVAGGAFVAGLGVKFADEHWPEHRYVIGLTTGVLFGLVGEGQQKLSGGTFSVLDAASNAVGAWIGAGITDRWILTPVVRHERGGATYGLRVAFD